MMSFTAAFLVVWLVASTLSVLALMWLDAEALFVRDKAPSLGSRIIGLWLFPGFLVGLLVLAAFRECTVRQAWKEAAFIARYIFWMPER